MLNQTTKLVNKHINEPESTTLQFSEDIGVMADRIGIMADRIGAMAEKILKTQEIQAKNIENTYKASLEMSHVMTKQMEIIVAVYLPPHAMHLAVGNDGAGFPLRRSAMTDAK